MAGLEPARCSPLVPETSASTNSATFAYPSGSSDVRRCHRCLRITSASCGSGGRLRFFPCQGKELVQIAALLAGAGGSTIGRAHFESVMAKLIVISGDERQEFELAAFNTIGRHPDNTIQILDRIISKEHAQIQRAADGRYLLRDLRSLNGTFMRGERIADHYLSDGDEFTMGSTRIVFVDTPRVDDVLQRVTIAPGLTESHIRGRIQANTGDFMPERQIADDKNLRRDYERLRIGHELARAVGSELDLDKLLPKILDKAFELVGADRGVILLM